MLDVLVFGATGYTGSAVAAALARRGARFGIAGRDRDRLEAVRRATGADEVFVAAADDVGGLTVAAKSARVLAACVGPFAELGDAAVEAALAAGVHYVDCTGEAEFVARLATYDRQARAAGVVLAPALAFDEVPADVAATLAVRGLDGADLTITYALPSFASPGTVRSSLRILTSTGTWFSNGERVEIESGERSRWAPLPPPLGPRPSLSAHMAEAWLAPLHLEVASVSTYLSTSTTRRRVAPLLLPALRVAARHETTRSLVEQGLLAVTRRATAPGAAQARWTVLAEATAGARRRSVVISGRDVYGLSAELLSRGAMHLADAPNDGGGLRAPVEAVGLDALSHELIARGATISVFEAR